MVGKWALGPPGITLATWVCGDPACLADWGQPAADRKHLAISTRTCSQIRKYRLEDRGGNATVTFTEAFRRGTEGGRAPAGRTPGRNLALPYPFLELTLTRRAPPGICTRTLLRKIQETGETQGADSRHLSVRARARGRRSGTHE